MRLSACLSLLSDRDADTTCAQNEMAREQSQSQTCLSFGFISSILRAQGYDYCAAVDGREGVTLFEQEHHFEYVSWHGPVR